MAGELMTLLIAHDYSPELPSLRETILSFVVPPSGGSRVTEVEAVEVIVTPEIDIISSISVEAPSTTIETINETAAPIAVEAIISIGSNNDSNEETEVAVETKVQEVESKVEQQISSADTPEPVTNTVESKGQEKTLKVEVEVDKNDIKQEIASNVANAILNTMDRYGAVAQVTQLAIMNSIGVGSQISTYQVPLLDQSTWYDNTVTIYESPQISDPFATILTGAQDLQMDALLSSGNY